MRLPLNRPGRVRLSGTTAHARPELRGIVLEDQLRRFTAGAVSGVMQDRVARSNLDGSLAFIYRIRELSGGNINQALAVNYSFVYMHVPMFADVDFRTDGLGTVAPYSAHFDGSRLFFEFSGGDTARPVTPTALSLLMFVILPGVTSYETGTVVTLSSTAFSAEIRNCFKPVIP